ncbi:transposase [Dehalococcoidia bacterium]|nr:transposase [Dehalococcoidia bacterium]
MAEWTGFRWGKWGRRRIRGVEKVRNGVILMAIGINFGRLWAYFLENDPAVALFSTFAVVLLAFWAKSLAEKSTGPDFGVA